MNLEPCADEKQQLAPTALTQHRDDAQHTGEPINRAWSPDVAFDCAPVAIAGILVQAASAGIQRK